MTDEQTLPDPTIPTSLSDQDKMNLTLSNIQLQLATANMEKATAQNESTSYAHKYFVLQLYIKYGLSPEKDGIDAQGNIMRNYAAQKTQ